MRIVELAPEARPVGPTNAGQNTVGAEIRRFAELQPNHAAIVASDFATLSYRDLQYLIDEVRAALRLGGFGRSSRIAVAMRDGPQTALAIVAVACSAVSIPLNPRQTLSEIETCLAALRPDAVLVVKGSNSAARRTAERKGITIIEARQAKDGRLSFSIEPQARNTAVQEEQDEPNPEASVFILQTSGTSAVPKLIPTSHRNMLAAAARVQAWFDLTPQDRCLSVSPVFYAHGLHVTVFAPLLSGGTIAFPRDTAQFNFSEWFGDLKPTWYSAGPALHRLVFDQLNSRATAKTGHSLRFVLSGGALLPRDVLEGLQATLGIPVVEHYGSSEGMQICSNLLPPGRSKIGTVGVPAPDTILIVGDDGRRLPPGQRGEILVGGPTVVSGYLDAPELNLVSFDGGWFKSGDIGSLDEDGFLTLHGRNDDLINRGGEKISPVEIDNALRLHPAIADAAAFPVPHARLGEDVAAAVVLRRGMTATPIELRGYLQAQLASFKVPRRIVIRDNLPKGQTGKVLRRQLTESLKQKAAAEAQLAPTQLIGDMSVDGDLLLRLTEIWERLLKTGSISPEDDFFESGGDSLLAMEMLVELDRLTGQTIPSGILVEAPTIAQLARKLSEWDGQKSKTLIRLNPGGRQPPLIYFHGDFNRIGYSSILLAKLLGPEQPLLVVEPHGMGNEAIPGTIEAMAADRVPLIMDALPEGPYRFLGACLGGIVAFECARKLIAAGKKVELIIMTDPPTISARRSVQLLFSSIRRIWPVPGPRFEFVIARTWYWSTQLQKFCHISWSRRWIAIRNRIGDLLDRGSDSVIVADPLGEPRVEGAFLGRSNADRYTAYLSAMSKYFPKPLAVRVIYFSVDYGPGVWRKLSPDFEVIKSRGNHDQPDYADVAKHLKLLLNASE